MKQAILHTKSSSAPRACSNRHSAHKDEGCSKTFRSTTFTCGAIQNDTERLRTIAGFTLVQYKEILVLSLAFALTNPEIRTHRRFAAIARSLHLGLDHGETPSLGVQLQKGYFADIKKLTHFNEKDGTDMLFEKSIPRCIEFIHNNSCYSMNTELLTELLAKIATSTSIYALPNVASWFKVFVPNYCTEFERGREFLMTFNKRIPRRPAPAHAHAE